jgi:hypothetical protein
MSDTPEFTTVEDAIKEFSIRMISKRFLAHVAEELESGENLTIEIKIKNSTSRGYSAWLRTKQNPQPTSFGIIKDLE